MPMSASTASVSMPSVRIARMMASTQPVNAERATPVAVIVPLLRKDLLSCFAVPERSRVRAFRSTRFSIYRKLWHVLPLAVAQGPGRKRCPRGAFRPELSRRAMSSGRPASITECTTERGCHRIEPQGLEGSVMTTFSSRVFASAASIIAIAIAAPLHAQDSAPATEQAADSGYGDIIVTAQKRAQNLNDVGLSITAASAGQLAAQGVQNVGDLAKITPGFTF